MSSQIEPRPAAVVLRETANHVATLTERGIRIRVKARATPTARYIRPRDWEYLSGLNDSTFDAACVVDFGVGVFAK